METEEFHFENKKHKIIRINQKSSKAKLMNKLNLLRNKVHTQNSNSSIINEDRHNNTVYKEPTEIQSPTMNKIEDSKHLVGVSLFSRNNKSKKDLLKQASMKQKIKKASSSQINPKILEMYPNSKSKLVLNDVVIYDDCDASSSYDQTPKNV